MMSLYAKLVPRSRERAIGRITKFSLAVALLITALRSSLRSPMRRYVLGTAAAWETGRTKDVEEMMDRKTKPGIVVNILPLAARNQNYVSDTFSLSFSFTFTAVKW